MVRTAAEIQNIIKKYIAQEFMYDQPGMELTIDTLLIEEEIIDSMGIFRLIAFLEEKFGFTLKHEEVVMESFETIAAIAALVEARLS
ncbi:MAG: acyl carrier protein [Candidatus Electrothrix sp. AUS1_2]|nr:acyl carrier protein [Candidatus Electrothrix sp. AUS1_2]